MEKISVAESDVVAIEDIANSVRGLRLLIVNVFAISLSPRDWVLIDCGIPHSEGRIRAWAGKQFGDEVPPRFILLTHGHFDHTGTVEELANAWDVPVYAHPLELPYLTGQKAYPPPDPSVGGGLMSSMSSLYPRDPVNLTVRIRTLPEDGGIPGLAGWRWLHTPGHTEGHVSFFRDADRCLIVGDAFTTTKQESFLAVATQSPELHGPPAYFTTDWDAARDSVRRLAELRPLTVAPGHGRPLSGDDVADCLDELAGDFDVVARPDHGRYVDG